MGSAEVKPVVRICLCRGAEVWEGVQRCDGH